MIIRRAVRTAAWCLIVLLPVMGLMSVGDTIALAFDYSGMHYSAWDIVRELANRWAQVLLPILIGIGVGGAFLLIADIHERLQKEA